MLIVKEKAKAVIGTYAYGWPPLAEATLAHKKGDTPLLETGALRDSIESKAEPTATGAEGLVYTDEKTGLWAEMGTSWGEPPRSFLMQSLVRSIPEMSKIFGAWAEKILAP